MKRTAGKYQSKNWLSVRRWATMGVTCFLLLFTSSQLKAQVFFFENFNNISGPTAGGAGTYSFPTGWTLVNVDNRTPNNQVAYVNQAWERREDFSFNVGDSCAFSTSYYEPAGAADDWMWTPAIAISGSNLKLSWRGKAYDADYRDGYEVRIMTVPPTGSTGILGNMVSSSTLLLTVPNENNSWTNRELDISAYSGQTVYIGFRNNSNDKFLLVLDDIKVERRISYDATTTLASDFEYTMVPLNQAGPFPLTGSIKNLGALNLTNLKLNVQVYNASNSLVYTAASAATASLAYGATAAFTVPSWTPAASGSYTVKFFPSQNETEQLTSNDTFIRNIQITDNVFARDNGIVAGNLGIGAGTGGYLGQSFTISKDTGLTSVTVGYNWGYTNERYAVAIWSTTPSGAPSAIVATSDTLRYNNDQALTAVLPIKNGGIFLPAGTYVVTAIEFDSTVALMQTSRIYTPGKLWVNWPGNPYGSWTNLETFGISYQKPFSIRMNLGYIAPTPLPPSPTRLYVKTAAAGFGTGFSWDQACTLSTALGIANNNSDITEIWVAAGVHTPTSYPANSTGGSNSRDYAFTLKNNLAIYGGFNGTETALAQRDFRTNIVRLSGAIGTSALTDNCYHVMVGAGVNGTAILDGVQIENGYADIAGNGITLNGHAFAKNNGGGLYLFNASPTIRNCTFYTNSAKNHGGGMYQTGGSPYLYKSVFNANIANAGGAIKADNNPNLLATSNFFIRNITSSNGSGGGGAIHFDGGSTGKDSLMNNVFIKNINYATGTGGGALTLLNGFHYVANNTFYADSANSTVGDMYVDGSLGVFYVYNNFFSKGFGQTTRSIHSGTVQTIAEFNDYFDHVNPQFSNESNLVGLDNIWGTDDDGLKPLATSGAINTGNYTRLPAYLLQDVAGKARIQQGDVDAGAYELGDCIGPILYVNAAKAANGNGSSWEFAMNSLADAIALAGQCSSATQIWVAAGTYKPTTGTDRASTFNLKSNLAIYGGFAGAETIVTERDPGTNQTILSGDIGIAGNKSDNCYHVVTGNGVNNTSILDGFIVKDGYASGTLASGNGGGMLIMPNGSPIIRNCVVTANTGSQGAGIACFSSSTTTFINCVVTGNLSNSNGGAIRDVGTSTFLNCTIAENNVTLGTNLAMLLTDASIITNCIVWSSGTGISSSGPAPTVTYSIVKDGYTGTGNSSNNPLFFNGADADGADNQWMTADDGLRIFFGSPAINSGTTTSATTDILGNSRPQGSAYDMGAYEDGVCFTSNKVYVNAAADGSGNSWANGMKDFQAALNMAMGCSSIDTILVAQGTYTPTQGINGSVIDNRDKVFHIYNKNVVIKGGYDPVAGTQNGTATILSGDLNGDDIVTGSGATMAISNNSENAYHVFIAHTLQPAFIMDNVTIQGGNANGSNSISYHGNSILRSRGGGMYSFTNSGTFTNNNFRLNNALFTGGGNYSVGSSNPAFVNTQFIRNTASDGGAIYNVNATCSITNTSFTANKASAGGGAIYHNSTSKLVLSGCKFFNDTAAFGGAVRMESSGSITAIGNVFSQNISTNGGGAAFNFNSTGTDSLMNNVYTYNKDITSSGNDGGAIVIVAGTAYITNNTFYADSASRNGGAIKLIGGTNKLYNNIFYKNHAAGTGHDIDGTPTEAANNSFSNTNPLFSNENDLDGADNMYGTADDGLSLSANSPAKNAGSNTYLPASLLTDIAGSLRIQNATVDLGAYENIISMITWTGAASTDWANAANWSNATVPNSSTVNVTILPVPNQPIIGSLSYAVSDIIMDNGTTLNLASGANLNITGTLSSNGTITGNGTVTMNGTAPQSILGISSISNITVNNANGLTIENGASNKLSITGTLVPQSGALTTNGNLVLASSLLGTARVSAGSSAGNYIMGNVKVERFVPGGSRKFRFLGHPFANAMSITELTDDIDITGAITGSNANGFTASGSNSPSAFSFTESNGDGSSYDAGWTAFSSGNTVSTIPQGQGIRVLVRGSKGQAGSLNGGTYTPDAVTIGMNGALKQGNFTQNLSFSNASKGWNLISNPYPSNIDWTTVTRTNVNNAIYTYRPLLSGGNYGSYVNGSAANGGSQYIESGSAFFVRANAPGASLGWHETDKVSNSPTNSVFRTFNNIHNRLSLTLINDSSHHTDEVVLRFGDDNATDNFDAGYDAENLAGAAHDLFVLDNQQTKYSIYHGSELKAAGNEKRAIKLGINNMPVGNYSIVAKTLNAFTHNNTAYLKDAVLNTLTEITDSTNYQFTNYQQQATDNRFSIVFNAKEKPVLSAAPIQFTVKVSPNPVEDFVHILYEGLNDKEATSIRIVDMNGKMMKTIEAGNIQSGKQTIDMRQWSSGNYTVQLLNGSNRQVQTIIKQ